MPVINKVQSSPAVAVKKQHQATDSLTKKAKTIMRTLQNMSADHECELLLCIKDKTGAIQQISTTPKQFNLKTLADSKPSSAINLANDDCIKQFVISLTNDMNLSSAASTQMSSVDSKADITEADKTQPPKIGKHATPEPPVLTPLDGIDFDEVDNSEPIRCSAFDFGIRPLQKV